MGHVDASGALVYLDDCQFHEVGQPASSQGSWPGFGSPVPNTHRKQLAHRLELCFTLLIDEALLGHDKVGQGPVCVL
eukprot:scaffold15249_cov20-Tisochrysis_lutea.AAC.1